MRPMLSAIRFACLLVATTGMTGIMTGIMMGGCLPASPDAPTGSGGKSGGAVGSGGAINGSGGATSGSGGGTQGSGGTRSGGSTGSGGAASGGSGSGAVSGSGGSPGSGGRADAGTADAMASGGAPASGTGGRGSGGTGGGGNGSGGNGTGGAAVMCTPPTGGSQGFTTRFWDCCKPSCAWPQNAGGKTPAKTCNKQNQPVGSGNQSACSGGDAHACWDMAPWAVSDTKAFAFAAFNGGGCGTCYELKFTGQSNSNNNDPGAKSMCGKTLVVQVVNIGGIQGGQFDIMIPGGGVGDFNACSSQWGVQGNALGERYGGVMLACQKQNNELEPRKACTLDGCNKLFSAGNLSMLKAGCDWTVNWLNTADNPKVVYSQIACPNELTSKSGLR
jgi:hypothetical protein